MGYVAIPPTFGPPSFRHPPVVKGTGLRSRCSQAPKHYPWLLSVADGNATNMLNSFAHVVMRKKAGVALLLEEVGLPLWFPFIKPCMF